MLKCVCSYLFIYFRDMLMSVMYVCVCVFECVCLCVCVCVSVCVCECFLQWFLFAFERDHVFKTFVVQQIFVRVIH